MFEAPLETEAHGHTHRNGNDDTSGQNGQEQFGRNAKARFVHEQENEVGRYVASRETGKATVFHGADELGNSTCARFTKSSNFGAPGRLLRNSLRKVNRLWLKQGYADDIESLRLIQELLSCVTVSLSR